MNMPKRFRSNLKDRLLLMAAACFIFFGLSFAGSLLAYRLARSNFDGRFNDHIAFLETNLSENERRIEELIEANKKLALMLDHEINRKVITLDHEINRKALTLDHEFNRKTINVLRGTNVGLQREIDKFK